LLTGTWLLSINEKGILVPLSWFTAIIITIENYIISYVEIYETNHTKKTAAMKKPATTKRHGIGLAVHAENQAVR